MTSTRTPTAPPSSGPEPARRRLLLANSTVALVLASTVAVTLHETAHAVAGLARGLTPTLYSNAVDFRPQPGRVDDIITAAAGPLFSLVLGLLVHLGTRGTGRGFARLFWMWLGLVSLQNFFGYLFIAPFARVGDTGQVLALLQAPVLVYVVLGLLGAALTVLNARLLAGQVVRYASSPDELRHTVLFPWLLGTGVVVVLTLLEASRAGLGGGTFPVIVAGAATTAIFAPMFTFFYRRLDRPYERLDLRRPVGPLVLTAVVALLDLLVLAPGLTLG